MSHIYVNKSSTVIWQQLFLGVSIKLPLCTTEQPLCLFYCAVTTRLFIFVRWQISVVNFILSRCNRSNRKPIQTDKKSSFWCFLKTFHKLILRLLSSGPLLNPPDKKKEIKLNRSELSAGRNISPELSPKLQRFEVAPACHPSCCRAVKVLRTETINNTQRWNCDKFKSRSHPNMPLLPPPRPPPPVAFSGWAKRGDRDVQPGQTTRWGWEIERTTERESGRSLYKREKLIRLS